MKKPLIFICKQKSTSFFLLSLRYYKDITNLLFWVLRAYLATQTQNDSIILWKTFVFIWIQKNNFIPQVFLRYCKDMQASYFGYFGHVWICTLKIVISTCRKFQCFSTWQKQTSSFTFSLRYYILKNPTVPWANSISAYKSRTRIFPDMLLVVRYQ